MLPYMYLYIVLELNLRMKLLPESTSLAAGWV